MGPASRANGRNTVGAVWSRRIPLFSPRLSFAHAHRKPGQARTGKRGTRTTQRIRRRRRVGPSCQAQWHELLPARQCECRSPSQATRRHAGHAWLLFATYDAQLVAPNFYGMRIDSVITGRVYIQAQHMSRSPTSPIQVTYLILSFLLLLSRYVGRSRGCPRVWHGALALLHTHTGPHGLLVI